MPLYILSYNQATLYMAYLQNAYIMQYIMKFVLGSKKKSQELLHKDNIMLLLLIYFDDRYTFRYLYQKVSVTNT